MLQLRDYLCCGDNLGDLHALVEHFEESHVVVHGCQTNMTPMNFPPPAGPSSVALQHRSSDSSLAGALGAPMPSIKQEDTQYLASSMASGFDTDDMELELSDNGSNRAGSSSPNRNMATASYIGAHAQLQQRLSAGRGSVSAVSSPPDTPLLATPISPVNAHFGNSTFTPSIAAQQSEQGAQLWNQQAQQQAQSQSRGYGNVPAGPAAFDSVHLPAKTSVGLGLGPGALGFYPDMSQAHKQSALFAMRPQQSVNSSNGLGLNIDNISSVLNSYAGYAMFSSGLPGAIGAMGAGDGIPIGAMGVSGPTTNTGSIQPGLLFGGSDMEIEIPLGRREPSPKRSRSKESTRSASGPSSSSSKVTSPSGNGVRRSGSGSSTPVMPMASTTLSRPAAALLLSKPFKCPTPGCMKSYKQANGLKYHVTRGQCNFSPPPELLTLSALGEDISEREAQRKLHPYCCQVAPCSKRYKNMNGLRYHYQHSGEHGAIGLRMLAEGKHDALKSPVGSPDDRVLGMDARAASLAGGESMCVAGVAPTPSSAMLRAHMTQSQPASAYASPYASPRSGSPYQQTQQQQQLPMMSQPSLMHAAYPSGWDMRIPA